MPAASFIRPACLRILAAHTAAGFLTYKLAVLLVGIVFPQGEDDAQPPAAPPPQ